MQKSKKSSVVVANMMWLFRVIGKTTIQTICQTTAARASAVTKARQRPYRSCRPFACGTINQIVRSIQAMLMTIPTNQRASGQVPAHIWRKICPAKQMNAIKNLPGDGSFFSDRIIMMTCKQASHSQIAVARRGMFGHKIVEVGILQRLRS